jgi:DNA-binding XRE family transcriptional regulator
MRPDRPSRRVATQASTCTRYRPAILLVVFLLVLAYTFGMVDASPFFAALGKRVRALREKNGMTLDDLASFGFSPRHWQQIESGRRVNALTILRICAVFQITLTKFSRPLNSTIDLKGLRRQMIETAAHK